ncbi:DUF4918 family protein [Elizabethkingia argentiflava]|uniref:DUF4918 family protein n=1 Tax=Elizabethkingia argenteiflava TaxID=2681556 RepID=A0A845PTB8_9FLAO|nr:SMUG2 DNA glycosylase family protein [Elizabethkingia argenteiflava]NAW51489.1 DUF4918 family protein [Elizabethkingia argenteiflava]
MMTFADQVVEYNENLEYTGSLPTGFQILNPYLDNPETLEVMRLFYDKYYSDARTRKFLIGINPSRHGAGVTGVPFTDTKRLESECGIRMKTVRTHEISSVFMYDMIREYGGVSSFYSDFYINSPFPLAIVRRSKQAWLNANYYDDKQLFDKLKGFMIQTLKNHIRLQLDTSEVFILGKKNAYFINQLNREAKLFDKMTVLEHPRFIQQYKSKEKQLYIDKYIRELKK